MCLIVLAHRVSDRFPLIVAANRDEDHDRPTLPVHLWEGEEIAAGRDVLQGGTWLAVTRGGRFAAVTNLRGAERGPQLRSRGELVTGFVRGDDVPRQYAGAVSARAAEYAGFHLLVGEIGGELYQVSGAAVPIPPGIHGLSNAPLGEIWPKVETAREAMRAAVRSSAREAIVEHLMRLLRTYAHGDPTRDPFIRGERYGTRSSTVIVAGAEDVWLVEQSYDRGGAPLEPPSELALPRIQAR